MPFNRRELIGATFGLALASKSGAQEPWAEPTPVSESHNVPQWPAAEHFELWPGLPPGAPAKLPAYNGTMNGPMSRRELWVRGVPVPSVSVFRPERPDGRALLSLPGGGYGFLSVQNEGIDVARGFNPEGVTVFVLAYRLPGEGWMNRATVPLQDTQRAMRLIRARAATWGIDPAKLGVVGFSAGGHLAATLATAYFAKVYDPVDAADSQSARPAFAGLLYPVITMQKPSNSRNNLLGREPDAAMTTRFSLDGRVSDETPPLFLAHATDDELVPVANSLAMFNAARAAKVSAEMHLFEKGGHGFGLHLPKDDPGSRWPELFDLWMRRHVRAG